MFKQYKSMIYGVMIFVISYTIFFCVDFSEKFHYILHSNEHLELDEIFMSMIVLLVYLLIHIHIMHKRKDKMVLSLKENIKNYNESLKQLDDSYKLLFNSYDSLSQPMTAIMGYITLIDELCNRETATLADIKHKVIKLNKSIDRLNETIKQIRKDGRKIFKKHIEESRILK